MSQSKLNPQEVTTYKDLLNERHVTPANVPDVYVIVDDYENLRIRGFAVYDGYNWELYDSFEEVVDHEPK